MHGVHAAPTMYGALQVLLLLQRLSNVLGDAAAALHPAALPILDAALDVQGEDAATLLEEALALWVVLMRNARAGDTAPLRVWRHWQPLAVTRLELAPAAMLAALSATLLGGVHFVQARPPRPLHASFTRRTRTSSDPQRGGCRRTVRRWRRWRRTSWRTCAARRSSPCLRPCSFSSRCLAPTRWTSCARRSSSSSTSSSWARCALFGHTAG